MLKTWNADSAGTWKQTATKRWTREAGLNELGFYYYGLSDSKAPSDTFCRVSSTIRTVSYVQLKLSVLHSWEQLRLLHPLLDSQFCRDESGKLLLHYCWNDRKERLDQSLQWHNMIPWDNIRDQITDCPRIISDHHLSQLRIYHESSANGDVKLEIVLICSHAISDGIRILSTMNDFMHFLGNEASPQIKNIKIEASPEFVYSRLPRAMESQQCERRRTSRVLWQEAIAHILHQNRSQKAVGAPHPTFRACRQPPRTTQRLYEFPARETSLLRETCRRNSCTIGHLIYAASTAAFAKLTRAPRGSTAFIGTPIDARRFFHARFRKNADEFVLALSFLSVFLPCVEIAADSTERNRRRLWTLARLARKSVHGTIQDPCFPIYSFIDQEKRAARHSDPPAENVGETQAPLRQLSFGSSSIGDLNAILQTDSIPFPIHDVGVGMRARQGEALMHSYSFKQRLRLSLVYDAQLGLEVMQQWLDETAKLMLMVLPPDELVRPKSSCL